jgi:hypothetical protein
MRHDGPYELADGVVNFVDTTGRVVTSFSASEQIAVAFDEADGILHKHGRSEPVAKWADGARRKFLEAGFDELVNSIVVVSFPPTAETIAELNACIAISGRVKDIVRRLSGLNDDPRLGPHA